MPKAKNDMSKTNGTDITFSIDGDPIAFIKDQSIDIKDLPTAVIDAKIYDPVNEIDKDLSELGLYDYVEFLDDNKIILDGCFTMDQLKSIIDILSYHGCL